MKTTYNRSGVALDQQSKPNDKSNEAANQTDGAHDHFNETKIERYELHDDRGSDREVGEAVNEPFNFDGNWDAQAKQLKAEFPKLAEVDLKYVRGRENELLTKIGITIGKKRDDLMDILKKGQNEKV